MSFTNHSYPDVDNAYNNFKQEHKDYIETMTSKLDEQHIYLIFLSGYMSCMASTINELEPITQ
jgi:folate-dependent phosphoribosylglycinamide formyltransferase PurN